MVYLEKKFYILYFIFLLILILKLYFNINFIIKILRARIDFVDIYNIIYHYNDQFLFVEKLMHPSVDLILEVEAYSILKMYFLVQDPNENLLKINNYLKRYAI